MTVSVDRRTLAPGPDPLNIAGKLKVSQNGVTLLCDRSSPCDAGKIKLASISCEAKRP